MTLHLRETKDQKAAALFNLRNDYYVGGGAKKDPEGYIKDLQDYFDKKQRGDKLFIIYEDDEPRGYARTTVRPGCDWFWLSQLLIDKDYRGKGIGTKTVKYFIKCAQTLERECFIDIDITDPIHSKSKNKLLKWYAGLGFKFDQINPADGNMMMKYSN